MITRSCQNSFTDLFLKPEVWHQEAKISFKRRNKEVKNAVSDFTANRALYIDKQVKAVPSSFCLSCLCVLATETSLLHSWYLLNMNFSKALLKGPTLSRRSWSRQSQKWCGSKNPRSPKQKTEHHAMITQESP